MGKRKTAEVMELDRTDLSTLLGCLASDLRNAGLAIRGMAAERSEPGGQETADMDRLAGSLDRVAAVLDAARGRLCKPCQLVDVTEQVIYNRGHE